MNKKNEIEVTEEMLKAAHIFLWDDQVSSGEDRAEILTQIYRAMRGVEINAKVRDDIDRRVKYLRESLDTFKD